METRLIVSPALLQRSFGKNAPLAPEVNSGLPLPQALERYLLQPDRDQTLAACNALHTNFVRGNGFIVQDGRLICKPPGALPLDGERYFPLDGKYTCLAIHTGGVEIRKLELVHNRLATPAPAGLVISGPQVIAQGENIAATMPVRLPTQGPTQGDEINFLPCDPIYRAAFTLLGADAQGRLGFICCFAGEMQSAEATTPISLFYPRPGEGLTLCEATQLALDLGMQEAILGGGSGDTQQYIHGKGAWLSLPRWQAGRPQAHGNGALGRVRGLGVILVIGK